MDLTSVSPVALESSRFSENELYSHMDTGYVLDNLRSQLENVKQLVDNHTMAFMDSASILDQSHLPSNMKAQVTERHAQQAKFHQKVDKALSSCEKVDREIFSKHRESDELLRKNKEVETNLRRRLHDLRSDLSHIHAGGGGIIRHKPLRRPHYPPISNSTVSSSESPPPPSVSLPPLSARPRVMAGAFPPSMSIDSPKAASPIPCKIPAPPVLSLEQGLHSAADFHTPAVHLSLEQSMHAQSEPTGGSMDPRPNVPINFDLFENELLDMIALRDKLLGQIDVIN